MKVDNFAISTNAFARHSLRAALRVLKEAGFRKIELWGHVSQAHPWYLTPQEAEPLAKHLRCAGFEIVALHPEGGACPWNPASDMAEVRKRAVDYYLHCLKLAQSMDVGRMIVHPGYGLRDHPAEADLEVAADSWRRIGEQAGKLGVELELLHCTAAHLGGLEQLRQLVARADAGLGICADVSLTTEEELRSALEDAKVRGLRLADGPGGHLAFGEGKMPMEEICRRISGRGLLERSVISLDNRKYVLDPADAVRRTAEQICAWKEMT